MESIKNKAIMPKVAVSFIVISFGIFFIWQWIDYYSSLKELVLKNTELFLQKESFEIEKDIEAYKKDILYIKIHHVISVDLDQAIQNISEGRGNQEDTNTLQTRLDAFKSVSFIKSIYVFLPNNKLIYSYPTNEPFPGKKIFTKVLALTKTINIIYDDPTIDNGAYVLPVYIPIIKLKSQDKIACKILLYINAKNYFDYALNYKSTIFKTNEAYLLKDSRQELTNLSQLKKGKNIAYKKEIADIKDNSIEEFIKNRQTGLFAGKDYLGKNVYANIVQIKDKNWYLVYKVDESEVFDAFNSKIIKYVIILFITLLFVVAFIILFIKLNIHKLDINILKELENNKLMETRLRRGEIIAKVGNWEIDLNTKEVFSSLGAREIYGVDTPTLSLSDIKKFPLPEYRKILDEAMEELIRFNKPYEVDFKVQNRRTGRIIDLQSSAVFNKEENKIYGVIKDVSDQNKIKQKLEEAEERLRFAVEASNYGIWDMDLNSGDFYWDENSFKLLGYDNNEINLSFEIWKDMIHPDDIKKVFSTFDKLMKNIINEFSNEYKIKNKSGVYIWILGKGKVASYNENGKPKRLVGVNIDINEKKLAELELKKIEWMLLRKSVMGEDEKDKRNLVYKTDAKGLIYENISKDILQGIMFDYLQLLETSSIVFELDGSYALGIFQSDWCINLHESKKLRKNEVTSGRCTICFYNEWEKCGKVAIEKKEPVNHKCEGGIEIYALPVFVFGQVIGAVCVALTAPSQHSNELDKISNAYNLPSILVGKISYAYDTRPAYILELAKERLKNSAKIIGTLIEKNISERDLFRNRELYKSLVESSDNIIVLVDSNGNILYVNNVGSNYFGNSSDKLIGKNLSELFPPKNIEHQIKHIIQVFNTGNKVAEVSSLIINGEERLFRTNIYPVKNKEGQIYAALVNSTDITELKEAELQKRSLEEMFYSLMDYFTGGIFIKDKNGVVLYANKYLREMFNADSWIGKNAKESFPGEVGVRLYNDDMNTFKDGYKRIIETIPCLDGVERYFETHKFIIERAEMEPLLGGLTIDLTTTIKAQQSLVEIKLQQERILNALPDIIFELDESFYIKWVNTFGEKYFGSDILGKHIGELVAGVEEQIKVAGKEAIDKVYYYESAIENNEDTKYFGWWFKAEYNENGNLISTIAAARDITDSKMYENKILKINSELDLRVKERTAELESANKELEAFTYSVSHDLRSPLRAIDGFSRIILEDYSQVLDNEGIRLFNVIRHNAKKMDQLITDLLQLSRVTRQQIEKEDIDLTKFISEIYDEVANEDTKSKFQFICNSMINIRADKTLLRQVWINLISNAIKYTLPKGNRVIEVDNYLSANEIITYIKDTGVGFNPEYAGKLFGVFQRLHRAEEFEGTGVGLAVVKRIVDKHGGRVWAESKLNEGSTFYIAFPKN